MGLGDWLSKKFDAWREDKQRRARAEKIIHEEAVKEFYVAKQEAAIERARSLGKNFYKKKESAKPSIKQDLIKDLF